MIHAAKHYAIRVWIASFIGAVAGMIILPSFSGLFSTQWMVLPVLAVIGAAFYLAGRLFAWIGTARIDRLMREALIWERAGMGIEVEEAFREAASVLDSYLFSPFLKTAFSRKLMQRLARHYLSKAEEDPYSHAFIASYINQYPGDRKIAEAWLGHALHRKHISENDRALFTLIGDTYPDNPNILMMLVQISVSEQRNDFHAIEIYRRALTLCGKQMDALIPEIARIFLKQGRADELSLKVYLMALSKSRHQDDLLKGLAACCHWVRRNHLTDPWLQKAETILTHIDASSRKTMRSGFRAEYSAPVDPQTTHNRKNAAQHIANAVHIISLLFGKAFKSLSAAGWKAKRIFVHMTASKTARTRMKWIVMAVFTFLVVLLVINTAYHILGDFNKKEQKTEPVVIQSIDPFTLQVAAYLKPDDAQRYVDTLKKKGLNAYLTQASGAKKKWFQVRVSHFKTKAEARTYGDMLKTKRIIEDYYVANYKRPQGVRP